MQHIVPWAIMELTLHDRSLLADRRPAGVILFKSNFLHGLRHAAVRTLAAGTDMRGACPKRAIAEKV